MLSVQYTEINEFVEKDVDFGFSNEGNGDGGSTPVEARLSQIV